MVRRAWPGRLRTATVIGVIASLLALTPVGVGTTLTVASASVVKPRVDSSRFEPEVKRLYLAYFLRQSDAAGLQYWTAQRASGIPLHQVSSEFARSAEFRRRYGDVDNSRFLDLVYRNVMDRTPDAAGKQYWLSHLDRGMSRGLLMLQFSESPEFQRRSGIMGSTLTSGGTSGSTANIPSNFRASDWLIAPWNPNPERGYPAFRAFCQFSHLAYADPIVAPGNTRFPHLHMFFGNTEAGAGSTYQSLRSSGNSTCDGGPLNRTAYWMPAVFDAEHRVVTPSYFELYYKAENAPRPTDVRPKPNGLRMIAGSPMGGSTAGAGVTWGWKCEGGSLRATIPNCGPGQRLTAEVRFPYCWDGRNLDSADHRSHMAYGRNNTWGPCPASHPVHLPELTEFAHFESPSGSSQWYLSSDRMNPGAPLPNGSTFHADWFGAWDNAIQERWVVNCLHGQQNASNGNLCDGQQLRPAPRYSGPTRISGWRPTP